MVQIIDIGVLWRIHEKQITQIIIYNWLHFIDSAVIEPQLGIDLWHSFNVMLRPWQIATICKAFIDCLLCLILYPCSSLKKIVISLVCSCFSKQTEVSGYIKYSSFYWSLLEHSTLRLVLLFAFRSPIHSHMWLENWNFADGILFTEWTMQFWIIESVSVGTERHFIVQGLISD